MDRRTFLKHSVITGGAIALGCSGLWGRRAIARQNLVRQFESEALSTLTRHSLDELRSGPAQAREEIRLWFHGKALNVAGFVEEICSPLYREHLHACATEEEQNERLLMTFCNKIGTDAEILDHVQVIAEELGQQLDMSWATCCEEIAAKWNISMKNYSKPLDYSQLADHVDQLVRALLKESLMIARAGTQAPALSETFDKIGKSALMLMPMSRVRIDLSRGQVDVNPGALVLALPTFVFDSLNYLFRYINGCFSDPRPDMQSAISARVSLLGNRLGSEFESEARARLAALHEWQKVAFSKTAAHLAETTVGWL